MIFEKAETQLTEADAINLALEILHEKADEFSIDSKVCLTMGSKAPPAARKRSRYQKTILEAVTVLTGLKSRIGKPK